MESKDTRILFWFLNCYIGTTWGKTKLNCSASFIVLYNTLPNIFSATCRSLLLVTYVYEPVK